MPRLNPDHQDKGSLADTVATTLDTLAVTTQPIVICGVSRKINVGNYETVDVYAGVALPAGVLDVTDLEALRAALVAQATLGFEIVSKETNDRYRLLKNL